MRNPVIFLVLLAALGLVACEQKVDVAAEEEAIKAVNQKQLEAYRTADYVGEAATWANEPYIIHAGLSDDRIIIGWDSLSVFYKDSFNTRKQGSGYDFRQATGSNYDIYLHGNIAVISYDQHSEGVWDGEEFSTDIRQIKYLEKIDGEWKIVAVF